MNWGYKILFVYLAFVAGIAYLVIRSMNEKIDLVTPDYYAQELKHQDIINEKFRAKQLSEPVKASIQNQQLNIELPKEFEGKEVSGNVLLYCTADVNKDHTEAFKVNGRSIVIALPANNKGLHEVHLHWSSNGVSYYWEEKILF